MTERKSQSMSLVKAGVYQSKYTHPKEWTHGHVVMTSDGKLNIIKEKQNND